ncbi:hypothetical protein ADIARSV_2342 [Arcticibacter svalbardensis MN12-7]|uniref:Uncharacterized protein n=2 Tax=Arcticibacter TaxID=1288026 RepID=R9GRZ5_9SPHI|nr:hypothetical protein ADIARSV_2342 [Arcticibacter svalbardensis MN12-7]
MYERIFHQNIHPDSYINIGAVHVNLGVLQEDDFKKNFIAIVEQKLILELKTLFEESPAYTAESPQNIGGSGHDDSPFDDQTSSVQYSSVQHSSVQYSTEKEQKSAALLFYLEHGNYPWWYNNETIKSPSEILYAFDSEEQRSFLFKIVARSRSIAIPEIEGLLTRFVNCLDVADCEIYINYTIKLYNDNTLEININMLLSQRDQLIKLFNIALKSFYTQLFSFIFLHANEPDFLKIFFLKLKNTFPISTEELKERIGKADIEASIFGFTEKKDQNINSAKDTIQNIKRTKTTQSEKGLYIHNAGLIVVHPFLPIYFRGLDLINDKNQFVSVKAQMKATVLLYYLQQRDQDYKEWEMPLNKILCGMNSNEVIDGDIELSEKEINESELLLQTVVGYWVALKGSSVESMLNTFFLREGKITYKQDHWLLQVERNGFDILLDRLPWSIGTIKLPWLKDLIHTEW